MNRFIKQTLLFIVPLVVIATISEILLRRIPNDYSYKKEYLDKNSDSIRTLVLGSSYAFYGINPDYLRTGKSFNSSHVSQQLKFDDAIIKKYSNQLSCLEYIILPVSYFTVYGNLEYGDEAWRIKNYIVYYEINLSAKFAYHTEVFTNKLMINLERMYSYYIKKKSYITCSNLGWGTSYNSEKNTNLLNTGIVAAKRHVIKNDVYFNKNINYLREILNYAKGRNIKVVLLTAPAFHTYVDNLDKLRLNKTVTELTKLDLEYENVTYTNMLQDSSFKEADFFDADHLNEIGAKKFTVKIDSIMTILEVEKKRNLQRKNNSS